ncbi:hypothetical protein [Flavobacterium weaverense]|uniref:PH (Pleckstrin Homology) domain-containing protein n=1 Tax=Flavobacterium weaverense TaxID=271156 RepID=A0A3L9ZS85_9FLAO|nr:hypothetical protein [Flavobacterium weaverense]RMA75157.1 hypothetical protein BC961_2514 [Flavobacterium weaverense]
MNLTHTFEILNIEKNRLIAISKKTVKKEIMFSDLDAIYITVRKSSNFNNAVFLLLSVLLLSVFLFFISHDIALLIPPGLIILTIIKMNYYKGYDLKIRLKNGTIFKMKFPVELKNENINIVNLIRKRVYDYRIAN